MGDLSNEGTRLLCPFPLVGARRPQLAVIGDGRYEIRFIADGVLVEVKLTPGLGSEVVPRGLRLRAHRTRLRHSSTRESKNVKPNCFQPFTADPYILAKIRKRRSLCDAFLTGVLVTSLSGRYSGSGRLLYRVPNTGIDLINQLTQDWGIRRRNENYL